MARTTAFRVEDATLLRGTPLNVIRTCELTWMCAVGDIHPNDDGCRVIAEAFLDAIS